MLWLHNSVLEAQYLSVTLNRYANTLLAAELGRGIPEKDIDDTLTFLVDSWFIHLQGGAAVRYAATKLGQACCAASFDPDVALEMYFELSGAYFREKSLLENELHLIIHPKRCFPRFPEFADNFEFSAERLSENAKTIKISLFA